MNKIKAFIIAAQTADGFIARDENHFANWTSLEDKKRFVALTKRAKVMIMGSKTYKTIGRPLPGRLTIVYSRNKSFEGVEMTQESPSELLKNLETRGFEEVAICGGAHIYDEFMKAGVVDKLYLTVEPILFGRGIPLFQESMDIKLSLISHEVTATGTIFKEYKIQK